MRQYYHLATVFLALFLSSCSTFQAPSALHHLTRHKRSAELSALNNWQAQGSLSIHYAQETNIASFDWQQTNNNYTINLSGPLSLAHFLISGNDHQVTLQKSNTEIFTAPTPEKLLQTQVGWNLPITNLIYWIKGMTAPQLLYKAQFDVNNHLARLKQQGWTIFYRDFESVNGIDLPTKLYLQNNQLKIKIVIKSWQVY